jgi:hypothetical protein
LNPSGVARLQPLTASSLSLGYDETEDRLVLVATDAEGHDVAILVTRRFAGRLINALCAVLEKTRASAVTDSDDLKDDFILIEYQGALAAKSLPPSPRSSQLVFSGLPHLLNKVEITSGQNGFMLTLGDARTPLFSFNLTRVGLHRLIDALSRHAELAAWALKIQVSWREARDKTILLN